MAQLEIPKTFFDALIKEIPAWGHYSSVINKIIMDEKLNLSLQFNDPYTAELINKSYLGHITNYLKKETGKNFICACIVKTLESQIEDKDVVQNALEVLDGSVVREGNAVALLPEPIQVIPKFIPTNNRLKTTRDLEIQLFDLWFEDGFDLDGIPLKFSPIEKIFYLNFMKWLPEQGPFGSGCFELSMLDYQVYFDFKNGEILHDSHSVKACSEYYIIDFVLRFWSSINKKYYEVAVELDGHDFHEKTKKQAEKDKRRDRVLQSHGYLVARFTGSEVYNDPEEVIQDIRSLAANVWKRELKIET